MAYSGFPHPLQFPWLENESEDSPSHGQQLCTLALAACRGGFSHEMYFDTAASLCSSPEEALPGSFPAWVYRNKLKIGHKKAEVLGCILKAKYMNVS